MQLYFLFLILLLSFFYFNKKKEGFENNNDEVINILTRTGTREKCYKKLLDSLNKQSYKNFRHIKSNDNKDCMFLNNEKNVINIDKIEKTNTDNCPYNLYLNKLIDNVREGWVIILDDDAIFVDNDYLLNLSKELKKYNKNDILITNIYNGLNKKIMPNLDLLNNDVYNIKYKNIDMGGIIFHSTNKTKFKSKCGGDYNFYKEAIKNYKPKFIDIPPGIWTNYSGDNKGKFSECM